MSSELQQVFGDYATKFAPDTTQTNYEIAKYHPEFATGDLTPDYPVHPYVDNGKKVYNWTGGAVNFNKANTHWGQRKLLLGEIDLLQRLDRKENYLVIYAGAADGRHMPLLTELFDNITLHLYDPRPFYKGIESDRILLNPVKIEGVTVGYFTDQVAAYYAEQYKNQNLVFISDIRSNPSEEDIMRNQDEQQRWIRMMEPVLSMVKFKVPYPDYKNKGVSYYPYMKGTIRFQAWAPVTSAETRLIVTREECQTTVDYPVNRYERNCAWFNVVLRNMAFPKTPVAETYASMVDTNTPITFDFVYETEIIKSYLQYIGVHLNQQNIRKCVDKFNEVLIDKGSRFSMYLKGNMSSYKNLN